MHDATAWLTFIEQSFLSTDQKVILRDRLQNEGPEGNFFRLFDQWLTEEMERREKRFVQATAALERASNATLQAYQKTKQQLEKDLQTSLARIEMVDAEQEQITWNEFYKALNKLEETCQQDLKQTCQGIVQTVVG